MDWLNLESWNFSDSFSWTNFTEIVINLFNIIYVDLLETNNIQVALYEFDYIQNVILDNLIYIESVVLDNLIYIECN